MESRFKSSIISTKEYLPACCRYIELNPIRAGMITDPVDYRWSSYDSKVLGKRDMVVDLHPSYLSLGATGWERQESYAEYVRGTVPDYEIQLIREALQRGQLTGSDHFRREIEKKIGVRLSNKKQGRPRTKK